MEPTYSNAVPAPGQLSNGTLNRRSYQVIARLVLPDTGEQWWPARTLRWTASHVFISFEPEPDRPVYVWLPVDDVRRSITVPAATQVDERVDGDLQRRAG